MSASAAKRVWGRRRAGRAADRPDGTEPVRGSLVLLLLLALFGAAAPRAAGAESNRFDLKGPSLVATVTRGGATLPISEVPNLLPGDQLALRAELPPGESVHYVLVAAFLRGAVNPPPDSWLRPADTWTRRGAGGLRLTVPEGADEALVFLAPDAEGGFATLRNAVRGRPGAFVRAAQDLTQASLDRSRLDAYLEGVRKAAAADPSRLQEISTLLARSLAIKLNTDCMRKLPELQAACLMEGQDALVLSDDQSSSIVQTLTTGNAADLLQQLSVAPQAGAGYYSPYVGAVLDIARLLDSFGAAQFQYLPALALGSGDRLSLILNAPPSFRKPKSVILAALPPVGKSEPPPLRAVADGPRACAAAADLVLGVDGAPLVFSTAYAHDLKLEIRDAAGRRVSAPVAADAARGGFRLTGGPLDVSSLGEGAAARLVGVWGFDPFEGPTFHLALPGAPFHVAAEDAGALVVGRDDAVTLIGDSAPCVTAVHMKDAAGEARAVDFKLEGADRLRLTLPLGTAPPGRVTVELDETGLRSAQTTTLEAHASERKIAALEVDAGDPEAVLTGRRLDEVAEVSFDGVRLVPDGLTVVGGEDRLRLKPEGAAAPALTPGRVIEARVRFKDGRTQSIRTEARPPRPRTTLLSRSVRLDPTARGMILFGDPQDVPEGAVLTFSLRREGGADFSRNPVLEIAGADGVPLAELTLKSGLVLADRQTLIATLDTRAALGASVFGPLSYRVREDGSAGDWSPLAVLVRGPEDLEALCPAGARACALKGRRLFLLAAVGADPGLAHPIDVPAGFTGDALQVPRPREGRLYVRLRDDPTTVDVLELGRRPPLP